MTTTKYSPRAGAPAAETRLRSCSPRYAVTRVENKMPGPRLQDDIDHVLSASHRYTSSCRTHAMSLNAIRFILSIILLAPLGACSSDAPQEPADDALSILERDILNDIADAPTPTPTPTPMQTRRNGSTPSAPFRWLTRLSAPAGWPSAMRRSPRPPRCPTAWSSSARIPRSTAVRPPNNILAAIIIMTPRCADSATCT